MGITSGWGHLETMLFSPPCFFFCLWRKMSRFPPIAAFRRLLIQGCLPKGRTAIVPGMWSFRGFSSFVAQRKHLDFLVQELARCPSSPYLQQHQLRSGPRQSTTMWLQPRQQKHRFTSVFLRTLQETHPILMWAPLNSFSALASSRSTYAFQFPLQGVLLEDTLSPSSSPCSN